MLFFLGPLGAGASPGESGSLPGLVSRQGAEPLRGERPFLFLRKKKRFLTPKKKLGRSTGRFRVKTAACVFTHCLGTSPGRYGHAMVEQGRGCGSIRQPPGCATLAAECGGDAPGASHPTQVSLSAAREAPHYPGPERGTRRRRADRAQTVSILKRQAVTAGRGPRSHTKAAGRRFHP